MEKVGLKLNIQKTKIMALPLHGKSMGKQWKQWQTLFFFSDFIFWGSKITADGDCSHEIKRCLLLRRKAMTNTNSILKNRHHFAKKGLSSQSYGFSSSHVWMWELDYKVGCWRIDAFKVWCWRRLLKVPWTTRRSNLSILKSWIFIGRTDCWSWNSNTLATWCKEPTHWKRP